MATVKQILQTKGGLVYSAPPTATVLEALQMMDSRGIGAVLVMEGEHVKGIFSERDYARRVVLRGKSELVPISDVMTRGVYYVGPDDTLETCLAQMTDKHIRHLPVVESGKVIGLVSIGDVVKAVISDQKLLIAGLENYILGREHQT